MSLALESLRRSGGFIDFVTNVARRAGFPAFVLAFALAYFLAAKVGIATSLPPEGIVILWPPNAVVLLVLLSVRTARWPVFLAATVVTEVIADVPAYPLLAAIGYGLVNFSEAALAAILIRTWARKVPPLATLKDFVAYLVIGPVLASGAAALFGAAIYKAGAPHLDYLHYWRVFWFGDAIGLLILGTTFLAWQTSWSRLRAFDLRSIAEALVLALGLAVVARWAFFAAAEGPRVYLIFPFLLWAALRFGVLGASAAILATVAAVIGSAVSGVGPFAALSNIDHVIALQGLIAVAALSTFLLAFASEDSRRMTQHLQREVAKEKATEERLKQAYRELEKANAELDRRVASRTEELQKAVGRNALLLKEAHHRIKNNLQIVAGLLTLYSRNISDPDARGKFLEVEGQVRAIAATYDIIHQMENADRVDFSRVVPTLCERIAGAAGPHVQLTKSTNGPAPVSADTAVALSLALNELVTNAIKHAASGGAVAVDVRCRREGDHLVLSISDDGPGFAPDFDLDRATGFGTRMARSVVAQAHGELRLVPCEQGAVVEISVPVAGEADEPVT